MDAKEEQVAVRTSTPDLPGIRKVVQLGDMYVLVETDEGIRLLDQHALHEKALYLCLEGHVREFEKVAAKNYSFRKPSN